MEVESPGYGGIVSRIWRYSLGIWSNSLQDMEVESPGYKGIVSGYGVIVSGIWR